MSILTAMVVSAIVALSGLHVVDRTTDYVNFYEPMAMRLTGGSGFTTEQGDLATRFPPGYPLLIAAAIQVGSILGISSNVSSVMLQVLAFLTVGLLIYHIARELYGRSVALFAYVLTISCPLLIYATAILGSELVFTVLLLASVLVFLRLSAGSVSFFRMGLNAVVIGTLAGAASLIRPMAIAFGVVLASILLCEAGRVWKERLIRSGGVLAGNLIVILPWILMVHASTGHIIPLSTGGLPTIKDGLTYAVKPEDGRTDFNTSSSVREAMLTYKHHYDDMNDLPGIITVTQRIASDNPIGLAGLFMLKVFRTWYGTESGRLDVPISIMQSVYALLVIAGLITVKEGSHHRGALLLSVVVIFFWLVSISGNAMVRYMVPVMPIVLLPAARFLQNRWEMIVVARSRV